MSPFWPPYVDEVTIITPELAEAVRITNAQPAEHVTPDTCTRCDGGCDECLTCDRPGCKSRWHRRPR